MRLSTANTSGHLAKGARAWAIRGKKLADARDDKLCL
jgi:hypothetical protein